MGATEAIELAREAAAEWRSVREMPAPRVVDVEVIAVHLIELELAYERRTMEREVEPAPPGAVLVAQPDVDPWSIEVDAPRDGAASKTRVVVSTVHGVTRCPVCEGRCAFTCDDCGGSGQKLVEEREPITGVSVVYTVPCGTCAGSGTLRCDTCAACGLVRTSPVVVVETDTSTHRAVVHGGRLDAALVGEMVAAGSARPLSATLVAECAVGDELPRELPPEVAATARGLLSRADQPGVRSHRRTARIHEGSVVALKLKDRVLHVFGEPPRVAGDDDPVSSGGRTALIVAVAAIAVGNLAFLLYLLF